MGLITTPVLEEETVEWPCPLIDRLSGLLRKIELLWTVLWASNMPKMHWRPGLCPGSHWGAHNAPPDLSVGWGGDTSPNAPPSSAHSAPRFLRLQRFDLRAPWKPGAPTDLELV